MLFELYGFLDGEGVNGQRLWEGNMFYSANHINGLNVDRNQNRLGEEFFSLDSPDVVRLQKTYIEKMVDTLNDLDNILWEICNEAPAEAMPWQYEMLRHLKAYERHKPKQHLVLLSPGGWKPAGWILHPETKFLESDSDCIATANGWIDRDNPKVYQIKKPVIFDLDHVSPGSHDATLVWKAFTRGYHFSLYDQPFEQPQNESSAWQVVRANIRQTRLLSCGVTDLARMRPRADLASTGFCLANEGLDYIVYAPQQEQIRVQGLRIGRLYQCEWFEPAKGSIDRTSNIVADAPTLTFSTPCAPAVLFVTLDQVRASENGGVALTSDSKLGLNSRSPVILDNDAFSDDWTLEYVLARTSHGELDLRGIIGCKAGRDGHTIYLSAEQTCAEASHLIELTRAAGLKVSVRPTLGANRGLVRPRSGRILDTEPVRSPGCDLIITEAHKATPQKPLVVMVGGHLTDVASAYLTAPSISNSLRVFYIGGQSSQVREYNTWCDYWAFWIVASKLPMVCLPIESLFSSAPPQMPFDRLGELPDNALGRYLREKRLRLEKLYPGGENDLAIAVYFLHPELVRSTRRHRLNGWAKDDKGEEVPVVQEAAEGNLLFITEADGGAGGREWIEAMTHSYVRAPAEISPNRP